MNGSVVIVESETTYGLQCEINEEVRDHYYRNNSIVVDSYTNAEGKIMHRATLIFDNNFYNRKR